MSHHLACRSQRGESVADPLLWFLDTTQSGMLASWLFQIGSAMLHAHATGGNVVKAGFASLLSSPLTSFGIGKLYGGTGSIGKELLRAGTHGLASGLASAMDGGSFGSFASGFISGGASAMYSYGVIKRLSPEGLTESQMMGIGFRAALIGGAACLLTGGNFLKGALFGYNIAMFNYFDGETVEKSLSVSSSMDIVRYVYYSGDVCAELPEYTVVGKKPYLPSDFSILFNLVINAASYTNTFIDSSGKGLERYSGNSTYGSNGKFYWKTSSQRPFIKNQYVTTQKLSTIGSKTIKYTGRIGNFIGLYQVAYGVYQDIEDHNTNGYNTVRAAVSFGAAWGGMEAGLYYGACLGGYIGAHFYGIGAIPGSIIGAAIGGFAGACSGGFIGGQAVDRLYEMQ